MTASRPMLCGTIARRVRSVLFLTPLLVLSLMCRDPACAETSYGIQVGAYQDLDHAVDRVNHLKRLGYNAFYQYETVRGKGQWYRVYIDRFPTRKQAREKARVLRDLELIEDHDIRRLEDGSSAPAAKKAPKEPPRSSGALERAKDHAPSARPEKDVVYLLHISSFKERPHAVAEARRLEEAGHKAFYVEEDLAGGHWFRVYIGQYESEKAARAAGERLAQEGLISYFKPLKIDRATLSDAQ